MDQQRFGATVRALRVNRRWRQQDLAAAAGVSRATISRIERGHCGTLSLDTIVAVAGTLDVTVDLVARWRGGELDRLLNRRHSAFHEEFARFLNGVTGWVFAPEVSFAFYGERGVVDILAWHAESATLLIIELKTELVDVQDLIGTMDRRRRLAARIGEHRGWHPRQVGVWVVVAEGATNRRRVGAHSTVLRAAFPADGPVARRRWLRRPSGPLAALSFFAYAHPGNARQVLSGVRRVRRPGASPVVQGGRRRAAESGA